MISHYFWLCKYFLWNLPISPNFCPGLFWFFSNIYDKMAVSEKLNYNNNTAMQETGNQPAERKGALYESMEADRF